MTEKENNEYTKILKTFDILKLDNIHKRRTAYKPLYDYFQRIVMKVGVALCNLDQNSLITSPLKARWKNIEYCLSYIEDPKIWDDLINEMYKIRNKVEHDDYYDPKLERLTEIRKKAPEFKDWIIRVAKEYHKKSSKFTFRKSFYQLSNRYINEAEGIIQEYGENTPYTVKLDHSTELEEHPYQQLFELPRVLRKRLKNITKLEDIKRSDLEKLVQIVEILSYLKGKEEILLRYSVCPKCGGEIKETQEYFGGTPDDPEPDGAHYRVGCKKCDYELHSETIYI